MRVEDISKEQAFMLATIFHQLPTETYTKYAERVRCVEPRLDRGLMRPDFIHRLMQPLQSFLTPLCGLHKTLDAKVVHQIFVLVATEVGIRMNNLIVAGRDRVGHETWDSSILNLRSLHGAWLRPEVFWDTFGKTLHVPENGWSKEDYMAKWVREEDRCEACILSRIGGDLNTVFDLQMVIRSRTRTRSTRRHHEPRLLKFIEGWLTLWQTRYDADRWVQKLEWNRLRAERLKGVRKGLYKEKQRAQRKHKNDLEGRTKHKPPNTSTSVVSNTRQQAGSSQPSDLSTTCNKDSSEETIKVYLTPNPSENDTDPSLAQSDDDDEEILIRRTVHDAENEIIDSYAALISTPFLPGMDEQDRKGRASRLSRHSMVMPVQQDSPAWPMIGDPKVQEQLARSQSTRHKRPSNYSESVYSQDFGTLADTAYLPPRQQWKPVNSLRRSNTVQEPRISTSGRSWVTASVAPSVATTAASASKIKKATKPGLADLKFDAIAEEPVSPRNYGGKFTEHLVSPIWEQNDVRADTEYRTSTRSGGGSPISPLTPVAPAFRRTESTERGRRRQQSPNLTSSQSHSHRSKEPALSAVRGHRDYRHRSQSGPNISSRLSKPFDGPTTDPGLVLAKKTKDLNLRDTVATDVTRWSALYGGEREKIAKLERSAREGTPAAPTSKKSERKKKQRK